MKKNYFLVLIIILILALNGYLLYYKNNNANKDENKIEKQNEEVIDSKQEANNNEEKVYDYQYGMEEAVEDDEEKIYNDYTNDEWIVYSVTSVMSTLPTEQHDFLHPEWCDNYTYDESSSIKYELMCFTGLSEEDFNKMGTDIELFGESGGQLGYSTYNVEDVKDLMIKIYGTYSNIFDKSFDKSVIFAPRRGHGSVGRGIVYSKNMGMIFEKGSGTTAGGPDRLILDSKKDGNLYKITYIDYIFDPAEGIKNSSGEVIFEYDENYKDNLKKYVDRFDKHTVIFELNSEGIYKYKETI